MYVIETGIIPPNKKPMGRVEELKKLKIGDSFICDFQERKKVLASQKNASVKLTSKKQSENCYRVWRIA
jgi:hypothetical protein